MLRAASILQIRAQFRKSTLSAGRFVQQSNQSSQPFRCAFSTIAPVPSDDSTTVVTVPTAPESINLDPVMLQNGVDFVHTAISPATAEMGYSLAEIAVRVLDVVHATTGLPWWATIVASTVAVRSMFFPISVMSMKNSARMNIMKPKLDKLQEEIRNAQDAHDPKKMAEFRARAQNLFKEHQVRPFLSFLMPLSQLPIFLGFFWGLQEITKFIPDYATDGTLWFENLAEPDPTYALPILSSALMIASMEAGGEGMPKEYLSQAKMGMRLVALIMVPVATTFQSGVLVYWVTSNTFTLTQTLLLKVPAIRSALGIPTPKVLAPSFATATTVTPFQAAVAQAQKGKTVQTFQNKPPKAKKN
ncbi:mitochondrial inner membrane protein OXA1 [Thraustotheca clavata]|uniref:Mitochondrial inner membrane protein OXA1 n=1 Tax=Thraustotheca clavata TaxID=74557 RepID=A0A1V9ZCP9_9STRA|nr:mitochondrial inner membrane protein OXA1 [Thraustotheca clavata]